MITSERFRTLALAFPESIELPHFEKPSFRVPGANGKIFASLDLSEKTAVLKLTELQQSVYCVWDTEACYPVPNKWGKQGWTMVQLDKVEEDFARDILRASFCNVAPKKLAGPFINE